MNLPAFTKRFHRSFGSPTTAINVQYHTEGLSRPQLEVKLSIEKRSVRIINSNSHLPPDHDQVLPSGVTVLTGLSINRMLEYATAGAESAVSDPFSVARAFTLAYLDAINVAQEMERLLSEGKSAIDIYTLLGGYENERTYRNSHHLGATPLKVIALAKDRFYVRNEIWEDMADIEAYYGANNPQIAISIIETKDTEKYKGQGHPFIPKGFNEPQ